MKIFDTFFNDDKYSYGEITSFTDNLLYYRNFIIYDKKYNVLYCYNFDKKIINIINKLKIYLQENNIEYNIVDGENI